MDVNRRTCDSILVNLVLVLKTLQTYPIKDSERKE